MKPAPNVKNRTLFTGDNLDVMRGINSESVGLIYLDPPFNSNRTYSAPVGSKAAGAAFKDAWTLDDVDVAWIGLIAEQEPALATVIDAAGVAHSPGMKAYLTMMAVRLLEMRRLLKPTGSIYLHCDPTASHYLKLVMDCVFGRGCFRNEITWKRVESHNTAHRYANVADIILYYSRSSDRRTWNQLYQPYGEAQLKRFKHADSDGRRYKLENLTAPRPDSDSGKFEWRGTKPGPTRGWGYRREQLEEWWKQGRIKTKRNGCPRMDGLKVYLDETRGKPLQSVWTDVPRIPNTSTERMGYPTQKPLKLLDRIIQASSNKGDVVLDPFCGCATTCVAAESLNRQWIGIDLSPKAIDLVKLRLDGLLGALYRPEMVTARTDIPRRTDQGKLPNYRTHRHVLYGQQEGNCNGCEHHFPFRNLTVDHVIPRSKGGTDHLDNLQLLCGACNSEKGTLGQAAFLAKLKRSGLRA